MLLACRRVISACRRPCQTGGAAGEEGLAGDAEEAALSFTPLLQQAVGHCTPQGHPHMRSEITQLGRMKTSSSNVMCDAV